MTFKHFLLSLLIAVWSTAAHAEKQIEERVPSKHPNGKVEIDIGEGSIKVVGWDRNEVEVNGTVGDRVERLEIRKGRRKVWVRAYVPKEGKAREAHLVVHAPHNNDIDVQVFQGPIEISGIEGDIELETFAGDITASGFCKRIEARTVNGNITVDASDPATGPGKVRAKTVSGDVAIRNVRREVEVKSISGSVTITASLDKVLVETISGDVHFNGGLSRLGRLEVETHNGDIVAVLPANLSAEFDITSYNGVVENGFNPRSSNSQDFLHGEDDPQAEIDATSFSGSIRVVKKLKIEDGATAEAASQKRDRPL